MLPLGLLCSMASRPLSRSRRCRLQLKVSPREPVKLVVVFTGHTAREPVVMHPTVWDHEVPLVMSQVIQATGRRILHTWVVAPLDVDLRILPKELDVKVEELLFQVVGTEIFFPVVTWISPDVRGAGSTSDKKSTPISYEILDFAEFHDSAGKAPGVVAHSSPPPGSVAQVVRSLLAAFGLLFGLLFFRLILLVSISSILVLVLCRSFEGGSRHWCWSDIR